MTVQSTAASNILAIESIEHIEIILKLSFAYTQTSMRNQTEILLKIPQEIPTFQALSFSPQLYPMKVIPVTEKLVIAIPDRDCTLLVYHLLNAQENCTEMLDT